MRQIDALESPRFTQITTFGRLPECKEGEEVKAFFLGIPFDDATSFRPGARFGPRAIREASRMLRPYNRFQDTYPFDILNMCDHGDVNVVPGSTEDTMMKVEEWLDNVKDYEAPFIAGGDHSITLPVLMSLSKAGKVNLIHFDSHFDTWDSYWGKRFTHGTWLRRAIEMGLVGEVYQVGIRSPLYSKNDIKEVEDLGINVVT
nr:arginase family protein [Sulfuracidifex tepidarius]